MNPIYEKTGERLALRCIHCNAPMEHVGEVTVDGEPFAVRCSGCGWETLAEAKKVRREIFEWSYDNGSRTIFWDVTALLEEKEQVEAQAGRKLPEHDIDPKIVALLCAWNPQMDDIATDRPTVAEGKPITLIPHPSRFVVDFPFLPIDGWHRLHKARQQGTGLKAILIPTEVEQQFRVHDVIHLGCEAMPFTVYDGSGKTMLEKMEELATEKVLMDTKA